MTTLWKSGASAAALKRRRREVKFLLKFGSTLSLALLASALKIGKSGRIVEKTGLPMYSGGVKSLGNGKPASAQGIASAQSRSKCSKALPGKAIVNPI